MKKDIWDKDKDDRRPSQKTAEQHPYVLKEKNCHSSILYPAKMFQKQGQSKDFFRHTTMEGIHHQQT